MQQDLVMPVLYLESFWVNAFVRNEWSETGGIMDGRVVRVFRVSSFFVPVAFSKVCNSTDHLFYFRISNFSSSISLRTVSLRGGEFCSNKSKQLIPKLTHEKPIPVGYDS